MKTTKLILAAIFALVLSGTTMAKHDNDGSKSEKFGASIQATNVDALVLRCINQKYEDLLVQVFDEDGKLISEKDVCKKCSFKLTYSLEELPQGNYMIKIMNNNRSVYLQKFKRSAKKITLL